MPAISPSNVEEWHRNRTTRPPRNTCSPSPTPCARNTVAIVDAGFLLQIDDPRLVTHWILNPGITLAECRAWCRARVEAFNHALRGIPEDRVRFHTCYGINMGPRVHDMELKDVADIILTVRAGAYSLEAANPRHEHEWRVWEDVKLPEGKILIPGVITQSSVLVEHPELIADRIERFAGVVGRGNVIAGKRLRLRTSPARWRSTRRAWASSPLAEGARLASRRLWR